MAGLITRGAVRVIGCGQDRLVTAITTLLRMGAQVRIDELRDRRLRPDGLHAAAVSTDVHPGFMTDWQTPLMVLFTQAEGMSVLHETVYEERFVYVPALKAMGGEIGLFATCLGGPACRFHDTSYLHSAVVEARRSSRAPRWTCPTCGPASPASSPRPPPPGRRCCTACATSNAATTARPNSCRRSGLLLEQR